MDRTTEGHVPAVSVSLVTYNHEKYVGDSIRSILEQTFTDFELIVVDDGSTDDTAGVVASFDDPRIVSIRQRNGGPSAATNRAIEAARGRYLALMTGDDLSLPNRLEAQFALYRSGGPRILFSSCEYIDDDGQPLGDDHFAANLFELAPRTRAQLLRRLFDGNFINAVTAFTETRLLREVGIYHPALYQLQDYDLWIRWVKKYAIEFMAQPTLQYRIRSDQGNLSHLTPPRQRRHDNELALIQRSFFDGVADELFREAFEGELLRPDLVNPLASQCEKAFILLDRPSVTWRFLGMERMHRLFGDRDTQAMLEREFDYPLSKFISLLSTFRPFDHTMGATPKTLYVDAGRGFNEHDVVRLPCVDTPDFQYEFDLAAFPYVHSLRWDPTENRLCRLHLQRVAWQEGSGQWHELDLSLVRVNGTRSETGEFVFETLDPMLVFPIAGNVCTVRIEGQLKIFDQDETLIQLRSLISSKLAA